RGGVIRKWQASFVLARINIERLPEASQRRHAGNRVRLTASAADDRQQDADQHGDNSDDNQKLDKGERPERCRRALGRGWAFNESETTTRWLGWAAHDVLPRNDPACRAANFAP